MSAWQIPLSINTPQFNDPAKLAQQRLSLQQAANQTQIQQQMISENALKLQAAQEDRADDTIFKNAIIKNPTDFNAARQEAIANGVRPRNLARYDNDHLIFSRALNQVADEKLKLFKDQTAQAYDAIRGVMATPAASASPSTDPAADAAEGVSSNPRAAVLAAAKTNLMRAGIDPDKYGILQSTDDAALRADVAKVNYTGQLAAEELKQRQAKLDEARAKRQEELDAKTAADVEAKDRQRKKEEAASTYSTVNSQDAHNKWFASLDDDIKPLYKDLTYSPETQQKVDNMALTAKDRAANRVKDDREQREDAHLKILQQNADTAAAKLGLMVDRAGNGRGLTPNAAATQGRFDQREVDADKKNHADLQEKEADLWAYRARLGAAIGKAGGSDTITDPKTGKKISIDDAKILADAAQQKAIVMQNQAREIRQKHQWGEFSKETATPPATTPTATPKTVPVAAMPTTSTPVAPVQSGQKAAPPASMLKEGTNTKFKNGGGTWTLKNGVPTLVSTP